MSKKDYIDAMNELVPRENLKKETLNKITGKNKKRFTKIYPILSMAAMIIAIVTIVVPLNRVKVAPSIIEEQKNDVIKTAELDKVGNFENLYTMIKDFSSNETIITDSVMESAEGNLSTNTSFDNTKGEETKYYSITNTQEDNVDEADIVKTDGNYIYYVTNEYIAIISVTNNSELKVVSKIEFNDDFRADEIFLRNDRLIAIGNQYNYKDRTPLVENSTDIMYSSNNTAIKVYNISNREKPELSRTVEVEGSYLSSRMVGDNIYLMSNKYIASYLFKKYDIDELNENEFKPAYTDTAVSDEKQRIDYDCIYCIPNADTPDYLNVVSFNVTNDAPASIETYLGAGSEIYASEKNLYVAKTKYNYENENFKNYELTTEIYKFALAESKCTFEKSGVVPGSILNQFSMDEDGEYFRIATTDSKNWENENNTNNLYVLNNNLEIVGKVEGLAKGERIYSVRFMGNRAYMVTFVQTDPLFVIDLSNPTNPTALGELKIPGYSKYLHPYDETHLIGFGENTKVVNYGYGDQVITDGMKMALFDVSDPNNPKEMYSTDIGERGTYSELLYNHKALLFSKEKNIIAFPISLTKDDYEVKFNGAIVYGLNLENGFTLKGQISHMDSNNDLYYSNNRIERIIYIGDSLFTLSNGLIKATDMNTMKELNDLEL